MMNPHGSGSSACISQQVSDDLKKAVTELIRQISWKGLFMVELLRDKNDIPWFVEFNGRTWGSMALSRRQGLEYPAWAVRQALSPDATLSPMPEETPPLTCRNLGRELMHLLFVLRGPRSMVVAASWPGRLKTIGNLSRLSKGVSLYNWRSDDRQVFIFDSLYTVTGNVFKKGR
jgi:hypothetical protein